MRREKPLRWYVRSEALFCRLCKEHACLDLLPCEETIQAARLLETEGLAIVAPLLVDVITPEHVISLSSAGRELEHVAQTNNSTDTARMLGLLVAESAEGSV